MAIVSQACFPLYCATILICGDFVSVATNGVWFCGCSQQGVPIFHYRNLVTLCFRKLERLNKTNYVSKKLQLVAFSPQVYVMISHSPA